MLNESLSNTIVIGDRDNNDTAPVTDNHTFEVKRGTPQSGAVEPGNNPHRVTRVASSVAGDYSSGAV